MQIHQLPASGTIADADMIPFDTGLMNKYIPAANLLSQQTMNVLPTNQDITTSVDALRAGRCYTFAINSYEHQLETGMPTNNHYRGIITKSSDNNIQIVCWSDVANPSIWIKVKNGGTWGDWINSSNSPIYSLPTSQDITVSVAVLTVGRAYFFRINSYGAQAACGVPQNENYDGIAYCATAANKIIEITGVSSGNKWLKRWGGTTWSKWYMVSGNMSYTPTAGSLMASGGMAWRCGGMMTWEIGAQVRTSGTLAASDYFGRIEGLKVPTSIHFFMANDSAHILGRIVNNNGGIELRNNNTNTALVADKYVIGSVTFPVEEV